MNEFDPQDFLAYVADLVVEMEDEAGCVGATAHHLQEILKNSIKAERNNDYLPAMVLQNELAICAKNKEMRNAFEDMTSELFTPEEEESFFGGQS